MYKPMSNMIFSCLWLWVSMLQIHVTVYLQSANGVAKVMFSVTSVRQSFCPPPSNRPPPPTCSNLFKLDLTVQRIRLKCLLVYLPSATKLRRLCFYRRLSVHTGVPGPGGVCSQGVPGPGGCPSMHWGRHPHPRERWLLLSTVRIYASYWNAFLFCKWTANLH